MFMACQQTREKRTSNTKIVVRDARSSVGTRRRSCGVTTGQSSRNIEFFGSQSAPVELVK
jgi:hypothetical protein